MASADIEDAFSSSLVVAWNGDSLASMSAPSGPNWPATIATARLTLRPAHEDDVEIYHRLLTDQDVRNYLGGPVEGERLTAYVQGYARQPYVFSIVTTEDGKMVGAVNIASDGRYGRREISYSFLPEHWGHGYALEAVRAALGWAFDAVPSEDRSIIAVTQEDNSRSRRLLEKLGMEQIDSFIELDAPKAVYSKISDDHPGTA